MRTSATDHQLSIAAYLVLAALVLGIVLASGCERSKKGPASRLLAELEIDGGDPANLMERLTAALSEDPENCDLIEARALLVLRLAEEDNDLHELQVSREAIEHCGRTEFLVTALGDPAPEVRARAISISATLGIYPMLPTIRYLLEDKNEHVRKVALSAVGKMGDQKSRLICLLLLKDGSWAVRAEAAHVLPQIGKPEDAARLFPMLLDNDDYVKYEAQDAVLVFCRPENRIVYESALRGKHGEAAQILATLAIFLKAGPESGQLWDLLANDLSEPTPQFPVRTASALLERDRARAEPIVRAAAERVAMPETAARLRALVEGSSGN